MAEQGKAALLQLQDVNLVYRALPALRNINWTLGAKQQWACLGPNGAGKTSLARVISRQATHFSGTLERSAQLEENGVAYVCFEQAKALCERDKKLDDSEFRPDATDPGTTVAALILNGKIADDSFYRWCKRLRIEHILKRGLRFISTGEMRKALLVNAILSKPALLILDSPLDGLDRASQQKMRAILDELLASSINLLLLCRQPEDIPENVTDVLVMNEGQMFRCGTRGSVLTDANVIALMNPPAAELGALPTPAPRAYELPTTGPLIDLHDVDVKYGDLTVLQNVNWKLELGSHCCVSGPNGCGKTTLLSLITGDNHKAYGQDITLFGIRRGSGESVWDIKQKYGQLDTQLHLNFARRHEGSRSSSVRFLRYRGPLRQLGRYPPRTCATVAGGTRSGSVCDREFRCTLIWSATYGATGPRHGEIPGYPVVRRAHPGFGWPSPQAHSASYRPHRRQQRYTNNICQPQRRRHAGLHQSIVEFRAA